MFVGRPVTDAAVDPEECRPAPDTGRGEREIRRFRRRRHDLRGGQRHLAAIEPEDEQPSRAVVIVRSRAERIGGAPRPAVARHDRDVLHAVDLVRHGAGHDAGAQMDAVDAFAGVGLVEVERAHRRPLDDEVSARHERAPVPHAAARHPPQLAPRDGIPREEKLVWADIGETFGEVRELLGEWRPGSREAFVRDLGAMVEFIQRTPQHGLFAGGDVGDARLGIEGHRLPVVSARGGGEDDARFVTIIRSRVRDRPTRLEIDPERPVDGHEVLRLQQLARGAVEHVEETVLGGLEQDVARSAIDRDGT